MSAKTGIRWTGATWNPMTGCRKVSPRCANSYMFRQYPRLHRMGVRGYELAADRPRFLPERIHKIPKGVVFVNSMSDTFHSNFSNTEIALVFDAMLAAPQHTYQVLTKRPNRVKRCWEWYGSLHWGIEWPAHIWLGTSVESAEFLPRIDRIAGIAPVTFLSAEPLLGSLLMPTRGNIRWHLNQGHLQWVITGGESGPGARVIDVEAFRQIRDACETYNIPYFHKQHGGTRKIDGEWGGHLLDGVDHSAMPATP